MSKTFDPIAPWFVAAEALGECIGIRFGRIAPGKTEPEWIFLRHAEFDGVGGLADILRRRGATMEELPQIKHPAAPSLLPLLKMTPKFALPRYRVKWQPFEQKGGPESAAQPPTAVAWHVFDEAATVQLRQGSRQAGVTVNTFLLQHLTGAIRPFLKDKSAAVPWMIPVNLRGKIVRDSDTANYSSFVSVRVKVDEPITELHEKIHAALDRREHWANWFAYDLGRVTTHGIRKFLIKHELATSTWNIGAFSNLGEWDPQKLIRQPDCVGDWVFCPPVLRFQRLGAGCITFQNRLTILIQAHPELTTDPAVPVAWVRNWVEGINRALAGSPAKSPASA